MPEMIIFIAKIIEIVNIFNLNTIYVNKLKPDLNNRMPAIRS